jgi:hypothetical protein
LSFIVLLIYLIKRFFYSANFNYPGLSDTQKRGVNSILQAWQKWGDGDKRKLAYILATAQVENRLGIYPRELGNYDYFLKYDGRLGNNQPGDGYKYRGAGFVQLTGKNNYRKMSDIVNIDLVNNPDLAANFPTAAKIIVVGMMKGSFTGKKLSDYFNLSGTNWTGARRIVNADSGDKAAGYAKEFYKYL